MRPDGKAKELPSMLASVPVARGDRIRAIGGIGGGYGNPYERSPDAVLEDVLDGYLTRKAARRDFGVAITPKGRINRKATEKLRATSTTL